MCALQAMHRLLYLTHCVRMHGRGHTRAVLSFLADFYLVDLCVAITVHMDVNKSDASPLLDAFFLCLASDLRYNVGTYANQYSTARDFAPSSSVPSFGHVPSALCILIV